MTALRAALPRLGIVHTVALPHRAGRALLLALLLVACMVTGWLWLRDAAFADVKKVRISGLTSTQAADVRASLTDVGTDMTTLHVRHDALLDAIKPYKTVAGLSVTTDFPDTLNVEVTERPLIAAVKIGGSRVPVVEDGSLLIGVRAEPNLPTIDAGRLHSSSELADKKPLAAVAVLAAAPAPLHSRISDAQYESRGLTLKLRTGPDLVFGDAHRLRAKWAAAARVLAEPTAVGAVYLDLRVPERVAAGGVTTPSAIANADGPAGEATSSAPSPGADSTVAPGVGAGSVDSGVPAPAPAAPSAGAAAPVVPQPTPAPVLPTAPDSSAVPGTPVAPSSP